MLSEKHLQTNQTWDSKFVLLVVSLFIITFFRDLLLATETGGDLRTLTGDFLATGDALGFGFVEAIALTLFASAFLLMASIFNSLTSAARLRTSARFCSSR